MSFRKLIFFKVAEHLVYEFLPLMQFQFSNFQSEEFVFKASLEMPSYTSTLYPTITVISLVTTLQEAICTGPSSVILSTEETQTPRVSYCGVGVQTLPGKRHITRSTQTWDVPQSVGNSSEHLATQVKKVRKFCVCGGKFKCLSVLQTTINMVYASNAELCGCQGILNVKGSY